MFERYYRLTKPGVLYGNVITGVAGFLVASGLRQTYNWGLFVATIGGMTLVIAAACVLNNVLDQDIDRIMERTKQRGVASGDIKAQRAAVFSFALVSLGMTVLILGTNWFVVLIGCVGFIVYVWLYGALSKRRSIHGTLVGSISGAMPILAGYCAVTGRLDATALLLFLALFFWQFPEFFSIAIYRQEEYKAANIPVLPVIKGVPYTIGRIQAYAVAFVATSLLVAYVSSIGWSYTLVMLAVGIYWLIGLYTPQKVIDKKIWARHMFHRSLLVILTFSAVLSVGPLLP